VLIASPSLVDPNFDRTVILLCMHDEQGAMGLVFNRPAPFTLSEIFQQIGIETTEDNTQTIMVGGPVSLENGLVLYEGDPDSELRTDEIRVDETLRVCPNRDLLEAIGKGMGPERYLMFIGHAGWAPGQLEKEIATGAWLPADIDRTLLFDAPFADRWSRTLESAGLGLSRMGAFQSPN
jgi:putative transcriptional regulator